MKLIGHPVSFKEGVRVILLVSRNKDGAKGNKTKRYFSASAEQFNNMVERLSPQVEEGMRLYASAEPRDVFKAIREFKHKQLENDYSGDPNDFYIHIESRWKTALMQTSCSVKKDRLWLIDCDTDLEYADAKENIDLFYDRSYTYEYETKNGKHILVQPFDTRDCGDSFRSLIMKNPMMLWAY